MGGHAGRVRREDRAARPRRALSARRLHAEGIALGIAHDRPRLAELAEAARPRLDDRRAEAEEAFDLGLTVLDVDVEVERRRRGARLLLALEVQARPRSGRVARGALALQLLRRDAELEQPGRELLGDRLHLVPEDGGPELGDRRRVLARERDVADPSHPPRLTPVREQIKQLLKNSVYRAIGEATSGMGVVNGGRSLRVLMYHKVNDKPGNRMSMPVSLFDEQMAQLEELGYTAVDLDAVLAHYG